MINKLNANQHVTSRHRKILVTCLHRGPSSSQ